VSVDAALIEMLWEKAPESGEGGGECVEVAVTSTMTCMRTSRQPQAGRLVVTAATWTKLTARIGRFHP
jgi:hypothetical protein